MGISVTNGFAKTEGNDQYSILNIQCSIEN
jgi:hypothetical protein